MQVRRQSGPAFDALRTAKALVIVKGANHCQWGDGVSFGVCRFPECHHMERAAQQQVGRQLAHAFAKAVAGPRGSRELVSILKDRFLAASINQMSLCILFFSLFHFLHF